MILGWNLAGREEVVEGRLRSSSKMSAAEDTGGGGSEWLALVVALLMKVERG